MPSSRARADRFPETRAQSRRRHCHPVVSVVLGEAGDVTPQPRPSAFVRCGRSIAFRAVRLMAGTIMRGVRAVGGLHGFAPAMIGVETFKRENVNDDTVSVRQWHYTEEPRNVELIPGSDPLPALGGVRTTVSLLDVEDRRTPCGTATSSIRPSA